jgi:NADH-quinone oxidoreductase subunit E
MLTEAERRAILEEAAHYAQKRGAGIEALKIVQRGHGWVSDEHLREVSSLLGVTPDELESVATFYSLIFREPVGEHVILICDSVSCWIMGYPGLLEHLKARLGVELGGTSEDNLFTLLPIPCLGTCDHAPAMMIDEHLYQDLTIEEIDRILDGYRNSEV